MATGNRAFDYAAESADAHRDDASVFVHGDAHPDNTLTLLAGSEAPDAECKLIDPKGHCAEPGCDLALIVRAFTVTVLHRFDHVGVGKGGVQAIRFVAVGRCHVSVPDQGFALEKDVGMMSRRWPR